MSINTLFKVFSPRLQFLWPACNNTGICYRQIRTSGIKQEAADQSQKKTAIKIYTRTGDKGTSSLFTGERRPKSDPIFEALGCTDELSSHIALAREFGMDEGHPYTEQLRRVQCILQDVSAIIATPKSSARESHLRKVGFSSRHADELEEWIDEYAEGLPELKNFILPGGGKASAALHIARTICRRAERCVAPFVHNGEIDKQALIYLNRLSDFLFTAARFAAKQDGREETIYIRPDPTNPKSGEQIS